MIESTEILTLIGINLAVVSAVVGFGFRIFKAIEEVGTTGDVKRARLYERLDEVRKQNKEEFTNKEVCTILHKSIDARLVEIAADVKILLKNGDRKRERE